MSKLFIVPTPVGNLEDMTFRAISVLKSVNLILAEDTRTSSVLLKHFEINNRLYAFHKFNEHKVLQTIIDRIEAGESMALISDAGTPGISDPGFLIVRACVEKNIPVECLPGATAFVPALIDSGFPCDKFVFEGFLPQKKGRQKRLEELKSEYRTLIFYESPYRIAKLVGELYKVFGPERKICLVREISKIHEEAIRGSIEEVQNELSTRENIKGEFVVIVAGLETPTLHDS